MCNTSGSHGVKTDGGRCGIYGVCDTEPAEGERFVRQWPLHAFYPGKNQQKQVQRERVVALFSNYIDL